MKKYISLLLSLILIVSVSVSFTACSTRNRGEEEKVEKVMADFMDEFEEMELGNMSAYMENPEKFLAEFTGENLTEIMTLKYAEDVSAWDELIEKTTDEAYKNLYTQGKEIFLNEKNRIVEEIVKNCDYSLRDIEKVGEKYVCVIEVRTTDLDDLNELLAEIDAELIEQEVTAAVEADVTITGTVEYKKSLCEVLVSQNIADLTIEAYYDADEDWESVKLEFVELNGDWVVSDASDLIELIERKIIALLK